MPFALLLIFVVLTTIYPGEVFAALVPYRITYWVGIIGLVTSAIWLTVRPAPFKTPQLWLLAGFTATLGLSLMLAEHWLGAPVAVLSRFGPSLTMFVLTVCGVTSMRRLRIAARCVVGLSLIMVAQGVAAYHFGYRTDMFIFDPISHAEYVGSAAAEDISDLGGSADRDDLSSDDGDVPVKRIRGLGLFHDPNDLALGLVVSIALLTGRWTPKETWRNLFLVAAPAMALGYGVFMTHSRGGTLALIVTLWRAFAERLNMLRTIVLLAVMVAGVVLLNFGGNRSMVSGSDESAEGRLTAWTEGIAMLKAQPLLGVGYGEFLEHHDMTAHNSFVLCFAETGLIGYFLWLGLLVITFGQLTGLARLRGSEPIDADLKRWATALRLSLIAFASAAFFLSRTFVPILYLVLGLSVALVLIARQSHRPVWSPSLPRMGTLVMGCEVASILLIYVIVKLHLL